MKKKMFVLAITMMLVLATIVPVLAATGTTTLTGGSLSIAPQGVSFGATLTGLDVNLSGNTTGWTATDPTGTGAGWKVSVAASTPTSGDYTIDLTGLKIKLDSGDISVTAGNDAPTSSITSDTAMTTSAQKLVSAATDKGMGTYVFTPTLTLAVPAETYAATYTGLITVTITTAP